MAKYIDAEELKLNVNHEMDMQDTYLPAHFFEVVDGMEAADVQEVMTEGDVKKWCIKRNYALVAKEDFPDIMEVRHGRWILGGEIGWPKWTCSVCGGDGRGDYKICPWCGVKMDEVEE